MKDTYTLPAAVSALMSPMISFRAPFRLDGMSPEAFDRQFPIVELAPGSPVAYALEGEQTVRFSHGGRTDGLQTRLEFIYRPVVADLVDDHSSIPVVPKQWRHVLADMALTMLFVDKNDDRANALATASRGVVAAMLKENRRRIVKIDGAFGWIIPRGSRQLGPQTEDGLILG
jgi:hypothetical protein